ncbi:MAG: uracil-DNA glycosylase [Bosea sp. (in: a-proteobacteria)]
MLQAPAMPAVETLTAAELADILAFHAEAGVDCALDELAHDRFVALPAPRGMAGAEASAEDGQLAPRALNRSQPAAPEVPRAAITGAALSADEAAQSATALARGASTLDTLKAALAGFDGCALKATAKNLCFADGNPASRIMLVGEAPGADEDRMGLPFVGVSGQLLDRMLAAIGLARATGVYIANIVPWRPPGNRTPTTQEMMICKPFIERQIELCAPDILVTIGAPSSQALLGVKGIMAERGKWRDYRAGTRTVPAMPMLHPAYLLRTPIAKRQAWADLRALKAALEALPPRT